MTNLIGIAPMPNGTTRLTFAISASERIQVVIPTTRYDAQTIEAVRKQVERRFGR